MAVRLSMRQKNIIAALVLICFGLLYAVLTALLPDRSLPNTPGPSFFPWISTALILALSAWLLMHGLRQPRESAEPRHSMSRRSTVIVLAAFVAYLVAMPALGFVLATLPFFAVMMVQFGERRPLWVGVGAVCVTALLYMVFRHGFGVFLPQGILRGILA